jgi:hypothetical protein
MDESKAIEQVAAAYEKLLRQNGRIQALEKKLSEGTITMKEGAELNSLRARAFGRALSGKVLGIAQGEREGTCTALLRKGCSDADELAQAAQRAALARQGLNLTPPTADFEEERARKIGHSLEDTTVPDETIQRRARSATENMLNSQYDRNMKKGADTCASAGLKTYIVRDPGSGCCKWCDEVSGKFVYGSEPKDVYRRHDNCTCTVTYESGRVRQNVWSKQTWSKEQEREYLRLRDELKAKKMTAAPDVKKPVRLSEKEVQAIINKVGGLTFGEQNGIINDEQRSKIVTVWDKIKSFFGATPLPPDITDEEVSQALTEIGFSNVDDSFFTRVDRDMRLSVVDQLKILEDRFHAVGNSVSATIAADKTGGAVASVSCPIDSPAQQRLHLSASKYRNQKSHVKARKEDVDSFFCMPCKTDNETLSRYVITHEYGHMLENIISQKAMNGTIRTHRQNCEYYKREIIDIAKGLDKDFDEDKYLSDYGHKNNQEFFAECFANSQLGKPNVLGKAMSIWLERRGY